MFVFVWMFSACAGCSFKMLHYVAFKGSYVSYDFLSLFLPGLREIVTVTCLHGASATISTLCILFPRLRPPFLFIYFLSRRSWYTVFLVLLFSVFWLYYKRLSTLFTEQIWKQRHRCCAVKINHKQDEVKKKRVFLFHWQVDLCVIITVKPDAIFYKKRCK